MDKLKKMIIIISIIIIILVLVIVGLLKNKDKNNIELAEKNQVEEIYSNEFAKKVKISEFFRIESSIGKYLDATNKRGSLYYGKDQNGEYKKLVEDDFIRKKVIDFLDKDYISKNKITVENVEKFIDFFEYDQDYMITNVEKKSEGNPEIYLVYGYIYQNDKITKKQDYVVVIDSKNAVFSIKPMEKEDKEIKEDKKEVIKNYNNKLLAQFVDQQFLCEYYFDTMKRRIILEKENFYNILENEYSKKRFENVEEFKKYVDKNIKEVKTLELDRFAVKELGEEVVEYILVDQYDNFYKILASTPTDYKIQLDLYTIPMKNVTEKYDSSKSDIKVKLNIDKWVKMLNNRDYKNAYKVLNKTFRENKFENEERFEEVMRKALPLHYKAMYGEFSDENGTYVQKIVLEDIEGKSDKEIKLSIIMELKDNYEFEMSFSLE